MELPKITSLQSLTSPAFPQSSAPGALPQSGGGARVASLEGSQAGVYGWCLLFPPTLGFLNHKAPLSASNDPGGIQP